MAKKSLTKKKLKEEGKTKGAGQKEHRQKMGLPL
jgi:hypothetical protein